jgi:hypothetical protein
LTTLLREDLEDKLKASDVRARDDSQRNGTYITAPWADIWDDPEEIAQQLAVTCRAHGDRVVAFRSQEAPGELESLTQSGAYTEAYIAVLHTIRQAFSPDGPLTGLGQESSVSEWLLRGFHGIARARWHLANDIDKAWRALHEARRALALTPLDSVITQLAPAGQVRPGAWPPGGRPSNAADEQALVAEGVVNHGNEGDAAT